MEIGRPDGASHNRVACAVNCEVPREAQDEFSIESYKRAQNAIATGLFKEEIAPVTIKDRKGKPGDHQHYPKAYRKICPGAPRLLHGAGFCQTPDAQLAVIERGSNPKKDESRDDKKAAAIVRET